MSKKDVIVLPRETNIPFTPYIPITRDSTEEDTTDADLSLLHNTLSTCDAALQQEQLSIDSICKLSITVAKLIETRRGVKKLPFGPQKQSGRTFEWLD